MHLRSLSETAVPGGSWIITSPVFEEFAHHNAPSGSVLISDVTEALEGDVGTRSNLIVVDERIDRLTQLMDAWLTTLDRSLEILLPRTIATDVAHLLAMPVPYSLVDLSSDEQVVRLLVRQTTSGDRPISDLLEGIRIGTEFAPVTSEQPVVERVDSDLLRRYASVLMLLREFAEIDPAVLATGRSSTESVEPAEIAERDSDTATTVDQSIVEQHVQLQAEHQLLKRRYDALANSRLGAWTLRRWSKKGNRHD